MVKRNADGSTFVGEALNEEKVVTPVEEIQAEETADENETKKAVKSKKK